MASSQGGVPPSGSEQPSQDYEQPGYENPASPSQVGQPMVPGQAGKKKRAYAGQAYDFGVGANSELGGQQPGGAPASQYGYPQQSAQQPAYGMEPVAGVQGAPASPPAVGYRQAPAPAVGGYQAPQQGYPTAPGVADVTNQFGQMGVSQQATPQQQQMRQAPLNQLYPSDLLSQPFNVGELDLPPPPIILPPNVSSHPDLVNIILMKST
jgi:protein transport protein SEC24